MVAVFIALAMSSGIEKVTFEPKHVAASYVASAITRGSPEFIREGLNDLGIRVEVDELKNQVTVEGQAEIVASLLRFFTIVDRPIGRMEVEISIRLPKLNYSLTRKLEIDDSGAGAIADATRGFEIRVATKTNDDGYHRFRTTFKHAGLTWVGNFRIKSGTSKAFKNEEVVEPIIPTLGNRPENEWEIVAPKDKPKETVPFEIKVSCLKVIEVDR